jgi:hypothetical protein
LTIPYEWLLLPEELVDLIEHLRRKYRMSSEDVEMLYRLIYEYGRECSLGDEYEWVDN